jgi:DNA-binding NtrC family response regulator
MKTSPSRLLFVDDEQKIHDLVDEFLQELSLDITHALSGEEGIKIIKGSEEFAVVASDYYIGQGITGGEFFRFVKEYKPKTSRVLVTGGIGIEDLVKMVAHGHIDGFAIKPFQVCDFIGQVQQSLKSYKASSGS